MADKENELKAQEAQIKQKIKEEGKRLVEEKQRVLDEKIKAAEEELKKAEEATKKREKELFVPTIRYMAIIFAVLILLFGYWAWWGYKVGVADEYSETVIGQKQITVKHFFRKDEIKTVDDTQRYTKALIQGDYNLKKERENTTVNDRVLKALAVSWRNLEFKLKEEQPKEQKTESNQTQAKQQKTQEQPKKQDKQAKTKTQAGPKPATAKDIKTKEAIETAQKKKQQQQSEAPATGLQASTPEQKAEDRETIEKAKKQYYEQKLQELSENGTLLE